MPVGQRPVVFGVTDLLVGAWRVPAGGLVRQCDELDSELTEPTTKRISFHGIYLWVVSRLAASG